MANSVDPDQAAPIGAVCSGSTLFVSILNLHCFQKRVYSGSVRQALRSKIKFIIK